MKRQSLLPRVLSLTDGAAVVRKPFKPPCPNGYSNQNEQLSRRLWARKRFVPWGSTRPALVPITNMLDIPSTAEEALSEDIISLPPGIEPLVLWQPEEYDEGAGNVEPISVDPVLVRFLRPHQRYFPEMKVVIVVLISAVQNYCMRKSTYICHCRYLDIFCFMEHIPFLNFQPDS